MEEAERILSCCAVVPIWHGSTTVEVVDKIMDICGGEVLCNGRLRKFEFKQITPKTFSFKTVP